MRCVRGVNECVVRVRARMLRCVCVDVGAVGVMRMPLAFTPTFLHPHHRPRLTRTQELQNPPDEDGASPAPVLGKHQRRLSAQGFNLFRTSVDNEGHPQQGRNKSNSWDAQGPLVTGQRTKSNSWDAQPFVKHFRTQSRDSNPSMATGAAAIEINNLKSEVAQKDAEIERLKAQLAAQAVPRQRSFSSGSGTGGFLGGLGDTGFGGLGRDF